MALTASAQVDKYLESHVFVGRNGKVNPKERNSENLYRVDFTEYQRDGGITGRFTLVFTEVEGDYEFVRGEWKNGKLVKVKTKKLTMKQ